MSTNPEPVRIGHEVYDPLKPLPAMVVHRVATDVSTDLVTAAVEPVKAYMERVEKLLTRIIGDDPDDDTIPDNLKRPGLLQETRDEMREHFAKQDGWKADNDGDVNTLKNGQATLASGLADVIERVEKLEREKHRLRKLTQKVVKAIYKEGDSVLLVLGKISALGTAIGTCSLGVYHSALWMLLHLAHFVEKVK